MNTNCFVKTKKTFKNKTSILQKKIVVITIIQMLWTMAATLGVDFANMTLQLPTLRACKTLFI